MVQFPDNASFTSADIKAVVHIPTTMEDAQDYIDELIRQRYDLSRDLYRIRNASINGPTQLQLSKLKEKAALENRTHQEISAITETIKQYQQFIREGITPVRVLAELSTISYSIHRETFPVRSLGSVYPKDYTKGPRTIAGSFVFTVFNKHVLDELLRATRAIVSTGVADSAPDQYRAMSPVLADQIPPFDVTIAYNNELGESSKMVIYGVQIVNEGQVTSVNDMVTENEMQYVARDIDLMSATSTRNTVSNTGVRAKTAKDVASVDEDFQKLLRRRNPFI